ncbi:MAG: DUF4258 domain-containing protein [Pseudolabrys sp.]|nr:DUF4258 domain-containing protein [Pseudolabrys sp.]
MTAHARLRLQERSLSISWIEATARNPDWTEPDPRDASIERRFRAINERSGRILRVVCIETETAIRVITATFDRNARRTS